jgi:hypothetical protein
MSTVSVTLSGFNASSALDDNASAERPATMIFFMSFPCWCRELGER